MANKKFFFILTLSCYVISYANEYEDRISIGGYYELGNVERDFLIFNDTTAYSKIATAKDTRDYYCFYESEYFMYSLIMALDYEYLSAYDELNRLLHKFFDENHLEKGDFFKELCIYFQTQGKTFFSDEGTIEEFAEVTPASIISYSQQFTTPDVYYNDSLLNISNYGDTLAYSHLLETLRHNCSLESEHNHNKYYPNRMLFFSIYHVDKNHSSIGYHRLYSLIINFYKIRGKSLSENSSRLAFYFLKKALEKGNIKAKNEFLRLEQFSN